MKYAYVGCRTTKERGARGKGIRVYRISENGTWEQVQTIMADGHPNPSFLALNHRGDTLYTVHGDFGEVSAFRVNPDDGTLSLLNTASSGGINPVHLSVDVTDHFLFTANLKTGTVSVTALHTDGSLGKMVHCYTIPGNSEGEVSHPHQVAQDNTGDFLVVSCQGREAGFGQIDVFRIHHETGELELTCRHRARRLDEPRHFVFHKNNRFSYGVNEKNYTVTYYRFNGQNGSLAACQSVPTLPDNCVEDGWASGIVMMPDGKHLVVSNRTHDSITSFEIDPETGRLTLDDCCKTGGRQPRFICVTPDGKKILAANELSDTIREYHLDPATGKLSFTGMEINTESPVCIIFK